MCVYEKERRNKNELWIPYTEPQKPTQSDEEPLNLEILSIFWKPYAYWFSMESLDQETFFSFFLPAFYSFFKKKSLSITQICHRELFFFSVCVWITYIFISIRVSNSDLFRIHLIPFRLTLQPKIATRLVAEAELCRQFKIYRKKRAYHAFTFDWITVISSIR